MAQRYTMPQSRPVDKDGKAQPEWTHYFGAIEELSRRTSATIAGLGAAPTSAEIATAFNALLAALRAAHLMEAP